MSKQPIIIVNDQDEVIGSKERHLVEQQDFYRVAGLWITNSRGDILLAQRKFTKKHDPGKWGPAVSGTLDEGETYESNIIKETEEEIGLKDIKPKLSHKLKAQKQYNFFCQYFTLELDRPADSFTIQEDEVEQLKWISRKDFERELREHPEDFVDGFLPTAQAFGYEV